MVRGNRDTQLFPVYVILLLLLCFFCLSPCFLSLLVEELQTSQEGHTSDMVAVGLAQAGLVPETMSCSEIHQLHYLSISTIYLLHCNHFF